MMKLVGMDKTDREEFETVATYLEGKFDDLDKKKKDKMTQDNPKQLSQMANTIRRALALGSVEEVGREPIQDTLKELKRRISANDTFCEMNDCSPTPYMQGSNLILHEMVEFIEKFALIV